MSPASANWPGFLRPIAARARPVHKKFAPYANAAIHGGGMDRYLPDVSNLISDV
jgi:hypothetical protein